MLPDNAKRCTFLEWQWQNVVHLQTEPDAMK